MVRQQGLAAPGITGMDLFLDAATQGGGFAPVTVEAAVRQAGVMPGHGKGDFRLMHLKGLLGAGSGVVHFGCGRRVADAGLKGVRVLADVVQQAGQTAQRAGAEGIGEGPRPVGGALQMVRHRLFLPILADVSDEFCCHGNTFFLQKIKISCF